MNFILWIAVNMVGNFPVAFLVIYTKINLIVTFFSPVDQDKSPPLYSVDVLYMVGKIANSNDSIKLVPWMQHMLFSYSLWVQAVFYHAKNGHFLDP